MHFAAQFHFRGSIKINMKRVIVMKLIKLIAVALKYQQTCKYTFKQHSKHYRPSPVTRY